MATAKLRPAVSFYKEDGKTKPITEKQSSWDGQTDDPYWNQSACQDVESAHQWEEVRVAKVNRTQTEKERIQSSQAYQTWWNERKKQKPLPSDPYRAYMIDRSLQARLHDRKNWSKKVNRADFEPIDFPPIVKGRKRLPKIPKAPVTKEAKRTKRLIRKRAKEICKDMDVDCPEIHFTTGTSTAYYSSGYARNRLTGEVVRQRKPRVVIGLTKSGKMYAVHYGTLAHELGHHKAVREVEKKDGLKGVYNYYNDIQTSEKARNDSERLAWKYADPYMMDSRAVQKWHKKYALGTYLGTSPPMRRV